jgi:hypothetical protein
MVSLLTLNKNFNNINSIWLEYNINRNYNNLLKIWIQLNKKIIMNDLKLLKKKYNLTNKLKVHFR